MLCLHNFTLTCNHRYYTFRYNIYDVIATGCNLIGSQKFLKKKQLAEFFLMKTEDSAKCHQTHFLGCVWERDYPSGGSWAPVANLTKREYSGGSCHHVLLFFYLSLLLLSVLFCSSIPTFCSYIFFSRSLYIIYKSLC